MTLLFTWSLIYDEQLRFLNNDLQIILKIWTMARCIYPHPANSPQLPQKQCFAGANEIEGSIQVFNSMVHQ